MTDVTILRGDTLKSGDTKPTLRLKLIEDGEAFNLSGYSVQILVKRSDADSLLVDAEATVEAETRGIVTYSWNSGETDTAGAYEVELVASDKTDEITFPNRGTETVYVEERLG